MRLSHDTALAVLSGTTHADRLRPSDDVQLTIVNAAEYPGFLGDVARRQMVVCREDRRVTIFADADNPRLTGVRTRVNAAR